MVFYSPRHPNILLQIEEHNASVLLVLEGFMWAGLTGLLDQLLQGQVTVNRSSGSDSLE